MEQSLFRTLPAAPAWRLKKDAKVTDVRATPRPPQYAIPVRLTVQPYVPHVQNFVEAIRGEASPACSPESAIETLRVILAANRAMEGTA